MKKTELNNGQTSAKQGKEAQKEIIDFALNYRVAKGKIIQALNESKLPLDAIAMLLEGMANAVKEQAEQEFRKTHGLDGEKPAQGERQSNAELPFPEQSVEG